MNLALSSEGTTVHARWQAAFTEVNLLGIAVGALGPRRVYVYEDGKLLQDSSSRPEQQVLAESEEFAAYLTRNITVTQDGVACDPTVEDIDNVMGEGAVLSFGCPLPVDRVDVSAAILTDLDPTYQTLATTDQGERFTFTGGAETHTFALESGSVDAAEEAGQAGPPVLQYVLIGALWTAGIAVVAWRARRHRRA